MKLEHWWYTVPLRLKSIFRRNQVEREMDAELQFHLENKIDEGIAAGLSGEEARYRALRALDGLDQRKEEIRDTRSIHWLTDFFDDTRYALRGLRRNIGLTAFLVMTMALGIGMTAAPFSMLDGIVLRPYPVHQPQEIVSLVSTSRDNAYDRFSFREYLDIRQRARSYRGITAESQLTPIGFSARAEATPVIRGATLVSGDYFRVLGVQPQLGRAFRDDEDRVPGRDAVAILGAELWHSEFASDPTVVGRTVRLNGHEFTVIGIAPDSFPGMLLFGHTDVYVPLAMARLFSTNPAKNFFEDRDDRELVLRGRLHAGTSAQKASEEVSLLAKGFERDFPQFNRDRGAAVHTQFEMRTRADDVNWKFSVIFTTLAIGVLLVACTNAAGLMLSRVQSRTREINIRLAMGAGRSRMVRLLMTESLVLAALGGLLGIAIAYGGIHFLASLTIPADLPSRPPFRLDGRVLFAAVALTLTSGLLCGLAPALQGTRVDLVSGLKTADVDVPGRKWKWGRNGLVVAQIATSLMLLAASFLMSRGFQQSMGASTTFANSAKEHVLMVKFDPRLVQYSPEQTQQFYQRLADQAKQIPSVESVGLTQNPPLGLDDFGSTAFVPEGFQMPRGRESFTTAMDTVDEDYFRAMGVPLLRGRCFTRNDNAAASPVVIVNEQFAQHYWPKSDALGQRIRLDGGKGPLAQVIGIAQNVRYQNTFEKPMDFIYRPVAQQPAPRLILLLRSSSDPRELIRPVQQMVRRMDANLPIVEMRTYAEIYHYAVIEGPGIAIKLVGTLGAVALFLAVAGLYGLIAYQVGRRTREIGIRMAIGARPADVLRLMMSKGLRLVAAGTVIGTLLGVAVERLLNAMIFTEAGFDLTAFLVAVPSMVAITLLATYVPARKASQIPPTQAIRYE